MNLFLIFPLSFLFPFAPLLQERKHHPSYFMLLLNILDTYQAAQLTSQEKQINSNHRFCYLCLPAKHTFSQSPIGFPSPTHHDPPAGKLPQLL